MINIKEGIKNKKGFTLIEMLVSISIFMSVMVIAMGSLISIINANKKSQAMKSVVDNVTFVLDSISRKVELGDDYKCSGAVIDFSCVGEACNCTGGGTAIQYYDKNKNKIIQYAFVAVPTEGDGNIQQRVCSEGGDTCSFFGSWQNLTGPVSNVNIKNMTFYVLGVGANREGTPTGDRRQPRLIITAEGSSGIGDTESNFILQTSVSKLGRQYYHD